MKLAISNFDMRINQNNSVEYEYNENGFVKTITCNEQTTSIKSKNGKINEVTNSDNNITYDEEGNPFITNTGLYQENTYYNKKLSEQRIIYDKENFTYELNNYDTEGFLIEHLDLNQIRTAYKYNNDQLSSIIYPRYEQKITFENRELINTFSLNNENKEKYDELGLLTLQQTKEGKINYQYN